MILDLLFTLIMVPLDVLIAILPEWQITLPNMVTDVIGALRYFNYILPMEETLHCLSLFLLLFGFMWSKKWLLKLIGWIRGSG